MPFDPRQPFEVISNAASGFDPNAAFEIIPAEESKPVTGARVAEVGGDVLAEAGGATAGQMIGLAGGPFAPITVPLGGFIGGGIGNTIAQGRRMARGEQDGFRFGELLASSAISAIPGGAVAKGASTAARIGRTAAIMGGASTAGSVVQQAIDRPEGESIDLGQAATSGAIGAAGGAVMQGGVEAAKPLLTKLATVFKRTPAATLERAGPEMVNDIAKAEGMSPSEVERAIANAIDVTPRKPAAQLALEDALAAQQAQRPRLAAPAPVLEAPSTTTSNDFFAGGATGGDTTFNLAGESAQDFTGIVNQQAEAAAARAAQVKAQRNLFDDSAQSGAIDPALLRILGYAAARGATGAAVGAVMADRPEDRAGHALAGALLGVTASPALARRLGQVAFTTTSLGRRAFPEATLPFALREELILKPGAVAATGHRGNVAQRALETALRREADPQAAGHEVWQFMTGQRPSVRPSLAAPATEARAAVDALSDALVTTGVATGPLADTITASQGRYLRRAYRIFQTPGWRPEQSVIDDWQRAYLAANPNATRQEAQDLALELLDRRNAEQFVLTGSILRQNRDAFTPRKNLDAPTLRLLGEITEPVELLGQTIPRMARLIETHQTQQNLAALGQQLGHFSPRSDPARGHIVQLAKDEEGAMVGPLAGLWTTPELREALESASANFGEQSAAWRILAGATAYSKFAKTVMNPESWVPNGVGALFDGLKNGNLRILANGPAWRDALAVAAEDIGINPQGAAGRAATQAIYTRMQRLGLAGQGSSADFQRGLEIAHGEAAKRGTQRAMATLGRGYAGSENVMRYMNWKAEMARYREAFPQLPADQLEEYAARVVRATTTNYAMIPDAVRKLSVGGVLGTFVNFPYEQFRHAYNMARIARDDLAQGAAQNNPALVRAGAARLAALLTAAAGTGAVAAWSLRENNITPDQDAALRRRFPSWDRNQSLIYQGRDGDNVAYMNQSYLNPQTVIINGGLAANRGQTLEEGAENALKSAMETFGGGSVLLKPGLETLLNRTERGRQISSPEDSAAQQGVDRVSYLADRAYSPGFLNSLTRFAKGYRGETGPDGQVYTLGDAAQRLIGKRINRVNLPYRFAVEARELNHRLGDVASSYEGVRRRELARPDKIDQAYALAETRRQVVFKDLTRYLADANTLGYDPEKSIRWLRDGGVPAEFILSALDGRYTPGDREPTKSGRKLLEEIRAKPEAERLSAFVQTVTSNPRFLDTVRTALREQARGITEADRLIGALDTDTRAAYLRNKLATQDERTRLEYLHDLARKRLLTPDVIRAMTK